MTHTEDSLMALALSIQEGNGGMSALRLAIREVLAEKDAQFRHAQAFAAIADRERERAEKAEAERDALAMQLKLKPAPMADCPVYCKTAVDLQAECERLRNALDRASRVMHGEGVEDQGEAWDKCLRILDAAMKEQP